MITRIPAAFGYEGVLNGSNVDFPNEKQLRESQMQQMIDSLEVITLNNLNDQTPKLEHADFLEPIFVKLVANLPIDDRDKYTNCRQLGGAKCSGPEFTRNFLESIPVLI